MRGRIAMLHTGIHFGAHLMAHPGVDYIDVFTPMLTTDGSPRSELFRQDALHLNEAGYALWRSTIRPFLH